MQTAVADRAALARVADGELDALQDLYDRYRTIAYSIALRITADAALAEDVVQDAFLGAWRNAGRYLEGKGSVKTWLLSIVHHRAVDAVRRRRPTTELPESDAEPPQALTLPDIWQEVAGNLDRDAIASALATLSDVQREAIELAYFCGLTQVEIADLAGVPLGTVKSRIRLGLLAMRGALTREAGAEAAAVADASVGGRDPLDTRRGTAARAPSRAPSFRLCPDMSARWAAARA